MGNMVTNVCVKSNYDQLRIDKALGFWKSDNNNKNNKQKKKLKTTFVAIGDLFRVHKFAYVLLDRFVPSIVCLCQWC